MVGRGIRSGVGTPQMDRHDRQFLSTPLKVPMRTASAGRPRPSSAGRHMTPPYLPSNSGTNSPIRGGGRNRSLSPTRNRATTAIGLTQSSPSRQRVSGYARNRDRTASDGRDPPPMASSDPYEEAVGEDVCDYDTSATVLYELLESSSWERARSRCRSHPDEVRTWIVRKDKSLQVRWKLLPLHAAIIFQAPNFLVSTLLEKYPGAASRKDDQGMLPLHLAFRHKQEDEDLLELLLVHYPKAVLIKDRRDRVPLEHGRESKFSAKLMRLYADATVAASRAMSGAKLDDVANDDIPKGPGHLTGGQRAILEAEYKEKILAVKVDYEKQIRKMKNGVGDEIAVVEQKHQEELAAVREDYEKEIRKLTESHERRLAALQEHHSNTIRQVEMASEEEREVLVHQHTEEINELREVLANQVSKDKDLADTLEKEIAHLQLALQERRTECDVARQQYDQLQAYNDELREVLSRVTKHQLQLQDLLTKQQEDVDLHRSSRYKLVQNLLRQEDDQGELEQSQGTKLIELCQKVRRKIDYAKEKGMLPEGDEIEFSQVQNAARHENQAHLETPVRLERTAERRYDGLMERDRSLERDRSMERDRGDGRFETRIDRYSENQDVVIDHLGRDEVERERLAHSEMGREHEHSKFEYQEAPMEANTRNEQSFKEKSEKSTEQDYGEVRILADEISAITENSDF